MPKFIIEIEYDEEDAKSEYSDDVDWTAEAASRAEDGIGRAFGGDAEITSRWED